MKIRMQDAARVPFYKRVSYLYLPALFVVTSLLLEVMMFSIMDISFPKAYIFSLSIILSFLKRFSTEKSGNSSHYPFFAVRLAFNNDDF